MFSIVGMSGQADKERLEKAIIRVKGVVSVALDQEALGNAGIMRILSQRQLTVRAVVRAQCTPDAIIAAAERQEFNISIFDPREKEERSQAAASPAASAANDAQTSEGLLTPRSGRSTLVSQGQGPDSPRYLTPPDMMAMGDRVVVSMEDVKIGKEREKSLSWIQKFGRTLWG